ncbi:MAG: hypothetical protein IJN34_02805, partial [Clostridia bacterium]|nr:hypothetical protein [Clostridia bacterium]
TTRTATPARWFAPSSISLSLPKFSLKKHQKGCADGAAFFILEDGLFFWYYIKKKGGYLHGMDGLLSSRI